MGARGNGQQATGQDNTGNRENPPLASPTEGMTTGLGYVAAVIEIER